MSSKSHIRKDFSTGQEKAKVRIKQVGGESYVLNKKIESRCGLFEM